jgi:hypothetical protein
MISGCFLHRSCCPAIAAAATAAVNFAHVHAATTAATAALLQGYAPGFPLLLPAAMLARHASSAMTYLRDGSFLDSRTRELRGELLTYNPHLKVLGYAELRFRWQPDGAVTGRKRMGGGAA